MWPFKCLFKGFFEAGELLWGLFTKEARTLEFADGSSLHFGALGGLFCKLATYELGRDT